MELRHLRYFIAVAEEGHFTRAAERLGMQQPPLSQQIRALEQELGFALLRRHPKGAALTAAGDVFLQEARAILDNVAGAVARGARASTGATGRLAVGFTSSAAAHPLIPAIMRRYREHWPEVVLEFREGNAAELTEALVQEQLDVAFLRRPVSQPADLSFHRLLEEELLLVLPVGHPALPRKHGAQRPAVPLSALRDERFILVRRGGAPGMYADLVDACRQAGFVPRVAIEVERMLTNISLVAAGAGVSAVPASMQGFHGDSVVYCSIQDAPQTLAAPLTLAWQTDRAAPPLRRFLDLALDAASA
jgi:DNA-binding transcriptional LysR family regulator